jgi:hypothetical protein
MAHGEAALNRNRCILSTYTEVMLGLRLKGIAGDEAIRKAVTLVVRLKEKRKCCGATHDDIVRALANKDTTDDKNKTAVKYYSSQQPAKDVDLQKIDRILGGQAAPLPLPGVGVDHAGPQADATGRPRRPATRLPRRAGNGHGGQGDGVLRGRGAVPAPDMASGKALHMAWKRELAEIIIGRSVDNLDSLGDHRASAFGQWYSAVAGSALADHPLFLELGEAHRLAHAHAVVAVLAQGLRDPSAAATHIGEVEAASQRLLNLLGALGRAD